MSLSKEKVNEVILLFDGKIALFRSTAFAMTNNTKSGGWKNVDAYVMESLNNR